MNQKKNRGFTLIELLAVIVILAIIALIAVPIIMNIISKANKSAFKDTAYGIVSAGELYFAERQLEPNGMLEDITIELPDTTNKLGLKGEVPTGSILITTEGKIAIAVYNNRYCVTKGPEDKDVTVTEEYESCELVTSEKTLTDLATTSIEVTSIPGCLNDGTECTPGTPIAIKVNATEVYNFYVISEIENEVTLIMDRNIGNRVTWVSKSNYIAAGGNELDYDEGRENNNLGPITALNYLNSETLNWTNIPVIESYTYDNNLNGITKKYGYQKLEITNGIGKLLSQDGEKTTEVLGKNRTRLLTYEEANDLKTLNDGTTPVWLYTNLSSSNSSESTPSGYWLLTTYPSTVYSGSIRTMNSKGLADGGQYAYYEKLNGIRPVITLKK